MDKLRENNKITIDELQESLLKVNKKKVSRWTINQFQHDIGRFKVPLQKAILSEKNRAKRLEYALLHKDSTFSNIIFTDESYFSLNRNTKKVFVFHEEEASLVPWNNPDSTVMVWGAICRRGKIGLQFVGGKITGESYIEILKDYFSPPT